MFPKIGVPQTAWFIMANPIKMDDLGVHHFRKPPLPKTDILNPKSWMVVDGFSMIFRISSRGDFQVPAVSFAGV